MIDTIQGIAEDYIEYLEEEDINTIKNESRDGMIQYHHGPGTFVRNNYNLWTTNPLTEQYRKDRENNGTKYIENGTDMHPQHPDEVSMQVLYTVWDIVNDQ